MVTVLMGSREVTLLQADEDLVLWVLSPSAGSARELDASLQVVTHWPRVMPCSAGVFLQQRC